MKKTIRRIILVVAALLVLTIAGSWLMIDSLAKNGIQRGGQYALGVPTDAKDVELSLLSGSLTIDQLKIANPGGFKSPHLMSTGKFTLEVKPSSVISSPVQVPTFVLDGLDINIEQAGTTNNISAVLNHAKQLGGEGGQKAEPADKGEGRKVKVGRLEIRNVVAHIYLPAGGTPLTVQVPAIEMSDVSGDGPDGVTIATLIARIFPAIMAAVVEKGHGIIPADLQSILNNDIAATANTMGGQAAKMVQQAGGEAAALLQENADKVTEDVSKKVGTPLKGLLDLQKPKVGEPNK